jgi:hypothetical protein
MRHPITLINKVTGKPSTGYSIYVHAYSTNATGYTGAAVHTYTETSNAMYYANITTTMKGTIRIVTPSGSTIVPTAWIGKIFQGDNQPTIAPGGSSS